MSKLKDILDKTSPNDAIASVIEVVAKKITDDFVVEAKQEVQDSISGLHDEIDSTFKKHEKYVHSLVVPKGDKGDAGKNGKDGKDGKDGDNGKDGKSGLDGKDGADGKDGVDGKDGEDGDDADVEEIKKEILVLKGRINTAHGGGNANRNMLVGGNSSTLSRYTDVNLKAGANITITYANNDNLKTTDITFASSGGGGGSVIGTTRSINTISTSQTAGSTTLTDYVYIASAGIQITLPTAVGNTNLYTYKNTSTSSVLLTPNGAEKIDTQSNAILAVQYTSVDLISDGANWQIT